MINWLNARLPLQQTWQRYASKMYLANNLNFYYCFGAIALFLLVSQGLTGLWLTFFYTPTVDKAFHSIEYIMRSVNYGWLIRYLHAAGASCFFIVLYLHLFRGILYGSYQKPRELVWLLGMLLLCCMMFEAIFGYVLPWGQVSYWGAQVMTTVLGAIPFIGKYIMLLVRGDYSVSELTLHRFFAMHVIAMPFLIISLVYLHIVALHHVGTNNPEGIDIANQHQQTIAFYPYYMMKDLLGIAIFACILLLLVFFFPHGGGFILDPLNHQPANPLVTPDIHPAWYVMPFYTMLRVIPSQGFGISVVLLSWLMLFAIPWLDKSQVKSMRYKGYYSKAALLLWLMSLLGLGVLGYVALTPARDLLARWFIVGYFAYFILMPVYTRYENYH